jgi:hypothetical protein
MTDFYVGTGSGGESELEIGAESVPMKFPYYRVQRDVYC